MNYIERTQELLHQVKVLAKRTKKISGFTIGNTAKVDKAGFYFTPLRETSLMICAGVIVYSEMQAIEVVKIIDGKVDYILVDAEKKVSDEMSLKGEPANVERAVRERISKSTLWIYKGNDLAVDAVDGLITQLTKKEIQGVGGKKVAILGAGNLGCKLALKLVERGGHVYLTRRDKTKLNAIVKSLNIIKPEHTVAKVHGLTNNQKAAFKADILIGASQGVPLITESMIRNLNSNPIVIDAGKGTLDKKAILVSQKLGIKIFRVDISAAFEGLIRKLWATERIVEQRMGRRTLNEIKIVSGGILGHLEEIVVDNIRQPRIIYGMANGLGDFIRRPSLVQEKMIQQLAKQIAQ